MAVRGNGDVLPEWATIPKATVCRDTADTVLWGVFSYMGILSIRAVLRIVRTVSTVSDAAIESTRFSWAKSHEDSRLDKRKPFTGHY